MADSQAIARWVVDLEDDHRHPGAIENLGDGAGLTRYGITSKWHSADVPGDYFTTMLSAVADLVAQAFYVNKFCQPLQVSKILSDELAASLVSFAVNDSIREAVKVLQQVLEIEADGDLGPQTLAAINAKDGSITAKLFRAAWADFYHRDVALNPSKAGFLNGWLRRAALVYPATL